jgi:anti-sigma factor RsiW
MTCREAIALLADFLDQTLPADAGAELDAHLGGCEACLAYLNTSRRARGLAAQVARAEMPEEMKVRLRRFLAEQLGRS